MIARRLQARADAAIDCLVFAVDVGAVPYHHPHRRIDFHQGIIGRQRPIEPPVSRDRDVVAVVVRA